jgi:hypothetical protein
MHFKNLMINQGEYRDWDYVDNELKSMAWEVAAIEKPHYENIDAELARLILEEERMTQEEIKEEAAWMFAKISLVNESALDIESDTLLLDWVLGIGGSFWTKQIDAFMHADHWNQKRLLEAFPQLLSVYRYKTEEGRVDWELIKEVMSECEVVILSKEESTVLDGSPKKLYELDGKKVPGAGLRSKGSKIERLNAVGAVLSEKYINNSLDS